MGLLRSLATAATSALLLGLTGPSLAASASPGVSQQHRVNLRVFFRAFCPACQWFVGDPLLELVRTEEYRNIVDLTLIPAAGMQEKQDGAITCEAGPLECTGHRWQVCVLDKDRGDVVKYLGTIACIEGDESGQAGDWNTKMKNCLTDEERVVVKECFDNRSKDLLVQMIREERSGSVPWMPYTIVKQKVLGSATEGVPLNMLKTSICSAYTGPKSFYPAECVKLVGEQKEFAPEETVVDKGDKPLVAAGENSQAPIAPVKTAVSTGVQIPVKADAVEGGDGDIVVDMKEEQATPAPADVPSTTVAAGKVQLDMYWRAFCPGCMSFITRPLLSLIRNKEFQEIIDFGPVPAAGTSFDAKGNFVCTAGMVECLGHKWLSCAVEEFHQIGELVERIACMESKDNKGMTWSFIINRCFEGDAHTKMKTCYDTKSDDLLRKNVAKRQALRVPWVPYVILNGTPLGDSSHGIGLKQLMDAVCKAYSGPKNLWPAACQPKRLRDEAETKAPTDDGVVKPCAPKKKDTGNTDRQYDDPPGIGKPLPSDPEAKTVTEFEAKVIGGKQVDDEESSSATMTAVVLPGVCFVGLVFIALRLSRDHKKDA
ncbi:Gamma interferon inducible lysosomal thiol reductase (GILT) [Phytophthora pseudosyringae]|uniref:Gamma interferon inducible lysosomal thiol reductase (GILT) n=1 Tax=Phytophthora pseudosyringae TaxID=221518 RepID=A0A8T1WJ42_9STRA|nr:Gamma interferon inducible lysosomal thiol reductase (GILT) [Phytophthora pseudosyringae]